MNSISIYSLNSTDVRGLNAENSRYKSYPGKDTVLNENLPGLDSVMHQHSIFSHDEGLTGEGCFFDVKNASNFRKKVSDLIDSKNDMGDSIKKAIEKFENFESYAKSWDGSDNICARGNEYRYRNKSDVYTSFLHHFPKDFDHVLSDFGPVGLCDFISCQLKIGHINKEYASEFLARVLFKTVCRVEAGSEQKFLDKCSALWKNFCANDVDHYFNCDSFLPKFIESGEFVGLAIFSRLMERLELPGMDILGTGVDPFLVAYPNYHRARSFERAFECSGFAKALSLAIKMGNASAIESLSIILHSVEPNSHVIAGLLNRPDELKEAIRNQNKEVVMRYCEVVNSFREKLDKEGKKLIYGCLRKAQLEGIFNNRTKAFKMLMEKHPEIYVKYKNVKNCLK